MSLDMSGIKVPYRAMSNADLLSEIENYAAARGIAPATVTSRAVGNSRLYGRLKAGGSCTIRIADELRRFMTQPMADKQGAA
ncbi:hypothetical protein RSWS8N_00025 [Cereibacter sphaeroides WS8N]|uniref:hypothetical protein n=1 Tax=Cereibacter TaxID=1653176 RepID=UPI00020DF1E9|nr:MULTISPECIES: hypothetical protein [Cereibacter]EGJ20417.1 hypothetical protein RSWS8N_00025 [Cereibacter sphaeroides WS8N]MEA5163542.1 hypothetical protein [Cereibacter johrii]